MDAREDIDAALDKVLRASGSALRNYTMPATLKKMREAMHSIMSASYVAGSNDCFKLMQQEKAKP